MGNGQSGTIRLTKSGKPDRRFTRAGKRNRAWDNPRDPITGAFLPRTGAGSERTTIGTGDDRNSAFGGSVNRDDAPGSIDGTGGRASLGDAGQSGTTGTGTGDTLRIRAGALRNRLRDAAGIRADDEPTNDRESTATFAGALGGPTTAEQLRPPGTATGGVETEGPWTPQRAERLVIGTFGTIAAIRRRPWWAIEHPASEVRPWSADLASVLNDLPAPWLQMVGKIGGGAAVAAGLLAVTVPRVQDDLRFNALPLEYQEALLAQMRAGGRVPAPQAPSQDIPRQQTAPSTPEQDARHTGGAMPTPAKVSGLSENGFAA